MSPTEAAQSDVGNGAIERRNKSIAAGFEMLKKSRFRGEMPPKKGKKGGKKQDDDWGEDDKKV